MLHAGVWQSCEFWFLHNAGLPPPPHPPAPAPVAKKKKSSFELQECQLSFVLLLKLFFLLALHILPSIFCQPSYSWFTYHVHKFLLMITVVIFKSYYISCLGANLNPIIYLRQHNGASQFNHIKLGRPFVLLFYSMHGECLYLCLLFYWIINEMRQKYTSLGFIGRKVWY